MGGYAGIYNVNEGCLLLNICCLLSIVRCLHYLLSATSCLISAVYYLPLTILCLLYAAGTIEEINRQRDKDNERNRQKNKEINGQKDE